MENFKKEFKENIIKIENILGREVITIKINDEFNLNIIVKKNEITSKKEYTLLYYYNEKEPIFKNALFINNVQQMKRLKSICKKNIETKSINDAYSIFDTVDEIEIKN